MLLRGGVEIVHIPALDLVLAPALVLVVLHVHVCFRMEITVCFPQDKLDPDLRFFSSFAAFAWEMEQNMSKNKNKPYLPPDKLNPLHTSTTTTTKAFAEG